MDRLSEIIKLTDELETFFEENSAPMANPAALNKINFLCLKMRGTDNYINAKSARIATLSALFFSARKHQKVTGGAAALYAEITCDLLNRIRDKANELKRGRV